MGVGWRRHSWMHNLRTTLPVPGELCPSGSSDDRVGLLHDIPLSGAPWRVESQMDEIPKKPTWKTKQPTNPWLSGNARHNHNLRRSNPAHRSKINLRLRDNSRCKVSLEEAKESVALKPKGGGKRAKRRNVLPQHTPRAAHHLRRSPKRQYILKVCHLPEGTHIPQGRLSTLRMHSLRRRLSTRKVCHLQRKGTGRGPPRSIPRGGIKRQNKAMLQGLPPQPATKRLL